MTGNEGAEPEGGSGPTPAELERGLKRAGLILPADDVEGALEIARYLARAAALVRASDAEPGRTT